jgi:hypothetical protein
MEEYPNNSNKNKQRIVRAGESEPKRVERITTGEAVVRKKPLRRKISEAFGGGDPRGVADFLVMDVLVPRSKDIFADVVIQGVERLIYGLTGGTSRRPSHNSGYRPSHYSHTPYNRYSQHEREDRYAPSPSKRARANHDFSEIILPTRFEADGVLDRLFDLVLKYDSATVADLYDLVGADHSYTDRNYGWVDLQNARVSPVREGYLIDLPRPIALD